MIGNTSSAVRAQRSEPHDSLDDFPTPPWAGRALVRHLRLLDTTRRRALWEPACNRGSLVRGLSDGFASVHCSDIFDYGFAGMHCREDFLWPGSEPDKWIDWTITNPPFNLAEQFITRALAVSEIGCAMLLRTGFLHGGERYRSLFQHRPPTQVLLFSERVVMLKGRLVRSGAYDEIGTLRAREKDPDAPDKMASTATDYSWFIWMKDARPRPPAWVPPSRLLLEQEGDYDG